MAVAQMATDMATLFMAVTVAMISRLIVTAKAVSNHATVLWLAVKMTVLCETAPTGT